MKVGVLAIQGDFAEHVAVLNRLEVDTVEVRLPRDLDDAEALIIPGGESTTFSHLMDIYELRGPIRQMAGEGIPIWGTCAGLIMMASELIDGDPTPLGLIDIQVARNAFGRQVESFETDLEILPLDGEPFRAVFIRAPVITRVGRDVDILAHLPDDRAVAVQQGNLLATAFHPELTPDPRLHRYFLSLLPRGSRSKTLV